MYCRKSKKSYSNTFVKMIMFIASSHDDGVIRRKNRLAICYWSQNYSVLFLKMCTCDYTRYRHAQKLIEIKWNEGKCDMRGEIKKN